MSPAQLLRWIISMVVTAVAVTLLSRDTPLGTGKAVAESLASFEATLASVLAVVVAIVLLGNNHDEVGTARQQRGAVACLVLLGLGLVSFGLSTWSIAVQSLRPLAVGSGAALLVGTLSVVTLLCATLIRSR